MIETHLYWHCFLTKKLETIFVRSLSQTSTASLPFVLGSLTSFFFLIGTKAVDLLKPLSALTKQTIFMFYMQVSDSELKSHKRFLEEVPFTG